MSEQYRVEVAKGKTCEREAELFLGRAGVPYRKERGAMGAVYTVEDESAFCRLSAELILDFYKLGEIEKYVTDDHSPEYYSLLGCLLGVERETEAKEIASLFSGLNAVNLDGFFTFDIPSYRAAWKGIATIAAKLYASCADRADKISLLLYMLDLQEKKGNKIAVKSDTLFVDETPEPIIRFFAEKDKNLLANIFLHRPDSIEIDSACSLSAETIFFLRDLGSITKK